MTENYCVEFRAQAKSSESPKVYISVEGLFMQNFQIGQEHFRQHGYALLRHVIDCSDIDFLKMRLRDLQGNASIITYTDRSGLPRRIERFVKQFDVFIELDKRIRSLLYEFLGQDMTLFKDKYNFKPPSGEGFYAHYDGVFLFPRPDGSIGRGWYEYADLFVNVLVPLDAFTRENGCLELSSAHRGSFEELLSQTLRDGSPNLRPEVVSECDFKPLLLDEGDLAIFLNSCPHQSGPNLSQSDRGSLYLTYVPLSESSPDVYEQYFQDKLESSNSNKALTGEIKD